MPSNLKMKSISMITLMFLSVILSVISVPVASAAGINETTGGLVNGQEHGREPYTYRQCYGIPGASLIVNAGTTINIPYGKHIDVEGAICVASVACGTLQTVQRAAKLALFGLCRQNLNIFLVAHAKLASMLLVVLV